MLRVPSGAGKVVEGPDRRSPWASLAMNIPPVARREVSSLRASRRRTGRRTGGALCPPAASLATSVLLRNRPSYGRCLVPALGFSRYERSAPEQTVVRAVPCARPGLLSLRAFCSGTDRRTGGALCPPWASLATSVLLRNRPSYGRCLVPALGFSRYERSAPERAVVRAVPCARPGLLSSR